MVDAAPGPGTGHCPFQCSFKGALGHLQSKQLPQFLDLQLMSLSVTLAVILLVSVWPKLISVFRALVSFLLTPGGNMGRRLHFNQIQLSDRSVS